MEEKAVVFGDIHFPFIEYDGVYQLKYGEKVFSI